MNEERNEIPEERDDIHEFADATEMIEGQNLKALQNLKRKNIMVLAGLLIIIFLPYIFPRYLDFDPIRRSVLFSALIFSLIIYLLYANLFLFRRINVSDEETCIRLKRHLGHMDLAVFMSGLLAVITVMNTFFISFANVSGTSMQPTLNADDAIIARHIGVQYARGDIVIVNAEDGRYFVKRIIALPGEHVRIIDGNIYIDDDHALFPLDEPYLDGVFTPCPPTAHCDVPVPGGHVYVLGDNRGNSLDSRVLGPISVDDLYGRVIYRFRPLRDAGRVN